MPDAQLTARSLESLLGEWRGGGAHYQALADRIRLLVLDGRIPIDTRLPAERDLAAGFIAGAALSFVFPPKLPPALGGIRRH